MATQLDEIIDFRQILFRVIKNWFFFVISLFIAFSIAFAYNRYTHELYMVEASILIKEDNSIATDIFINKSNSYLKDDCLVEINPEKTEFLSIDNTVGNSTKGILIGDYKLEKVENQKLRKLGIMETPNLEDKIEEQAF